MTPFVFPSLSPLRRLLHGLMAQMSAVWLFGKWNRRLSLMVDCQCQRHFRGKKRDPSPTILRGSGKKRQVGLHLLPENGHFNTVEN